MQVLSLISEEDLHFNWWLALIIQKMAQSGFPPKFPTTFVYGYATRASQLSKKKYKQCNAMTTWMLYEPC